MHFSSECLVVNCFIANSKMTFVISWNSKCEMCQIIVFIARCDRNLFRTFDIRTDNANLLVTVSILNLCSNLLLEHFNMFRLPLTPLLALGHNETLPTRTLGMLNSSCVVDFIFSTRYSRALGLFFFFKKGLFSDTSL